MSSNRCVTSAALALLLSAYFVGPSSAHSWVRCTDYRVADPRAEPQGPAETDPLRRLYDESACQGYAPSFPSGTEFGADTGYEHRPSVDQMCLSRDNTYSEDRPMATYSAGSTVCMAYPAKNHVAAECTNEFIPDQALKIYRSNVGPSNDAFVSIDEFQANELSHLNGEHETNQIDYLGFQNCPEFCGEGGTDRVLCTVCFELESDIAPGMYQFAWRWEFNAGELYSTCWSAEVQSDANPDNPGANPGANPDVNPGVNPGVSPGSGAGNEAGNEGGGSSASTNGSGGGGGGLGTGASIGVTLVVFLVVLGGGTLAYNMWWKKRPANAAAGAEMRV